MACNITSGIPSGSLCRDTSGGINTVYFANFITGVTLGETSEGTIDTQTGLTAKFYEVKPNKASSEYVENVQSSLENGTIGYMQELTLVLGKNEAEKRNLVKLLGQATTYIIIHTKSNKYFLMGETEGCELTGGNSATGKVTNDLNGWNLVFTSDNNEPAKEIEASLISELLAV